MRPSKKSSPISKMSKQDQEAMAADIFCIADIPPPPPPVDEDDEDCVFDDDDQFF